MPKRLPYEVAILAVLLAGSCSDPARLRTNSEIEEIAEGVAADTVTEHPRVVALYNRMRQVEDRVTELENQDRALRAGSSDPLNLNSRIENAQDRIDGLIRTLRQSGVVQ